MPEMYEPEEPMPLQQVPVMQGLTTEGALQYQFENPELVEVMLHYFVGEIKVGDPKTGGNKWEVAFEPLINQKGLSKLRGYMTMFLMGSKNFALTDVNDDYISESVMNVGRIIKNDFNDNWNLYKIKDDASASFMIDVVTDLAYTIKKKGEGATYLKFLTKTHNVQEIQHHSGMNRPPEKDKGVMNMIFGKKR